MAEKNTVARPYAEAVFELAKDQDALPEWSEMLKLLAYIVGDARVQALIGNPRVTKNQLIELISGVAGQKLTESARNFLNVLVDNDRLPVLPEIVGLYEAYRAEAERTVEAEIVSAFPVTEEQKAQLGAALKKRLAKEVKLRCRQDESLIGGAVIRAGDLVIDGSVTGQLERLRTAFTH